MFPNATPILPNRISPDTFISPLYSSLLNNASTFKTSNLGKLLHLMKFKNSEARQLCVISLRDNIFEALEAIETAFDIKFDVDSHVSVHANANFILPGLYHKSNKRQRTFWHFTFAYTTPESPKYQKLKIYFNDNNAVIEYDMLQSPLQQACTKAILQNEKIKNIIIEIGLLFMEQRYLPAAQQLFLFNSTARNSPAPVAPTNESNELFWSFLNLYFRALMKDKTDDTFESGSSIFPNEETYKAFWHKFSQKLAAMYNLSNKQVSKIIWSARYDAVRMARLTAEMLLKILDQDTEVRESIINKISDKKLLDGSTSSKDDLVAVFKKQHALLLEGKIENLNGKRLNRTTPESHSWVRHQAKMSESHAWIKRQFKI